MANPYVNRVDLADGTTLIDLTSDSVTAGKMLSGTTAHDKSGAAITGNIATKTSADMTVSGDTVAVPAGYYASAASKAVSSGTVTNNTTLPSGSSSSGTINRGNYIKIGAGYHSEKYYLAQANSGTKAITQSGTTNVDGYQYVSVPDDCVIVEVTATSSTTKTINNSKITSDFYVFNTASEKPVSDVSWSTASGSVTLTCSNGIPAMTLFLCRQL